jgi:1,4-dihydroxy-2-naphthoate octaprenyltransferase
MDTATQASFGAGLWRLADPKVSLASFASLFLGASAATMAGPLAWDWLALTVAAIFAVEVAKNASGEVFDFDSGVDQAVAAQDRSPFSGGKRVLVDGLLTRAQTWGIALAGYALAIAAGLWLVFVCGRDVLAPGVIGLALAYFYHAPPLRLSYRGFGELAVAFAYGPLIANGTFVVLTGGRNPLLLLLSLALGLLIAAFLVANEFPDYRADAAGGKRNLVVRLGRPRAAWLFAALVLAALLIHLAAAWPSGRHWLLLALVAWIPAARAARCLIREPEHVPDIVPAQGAALLAFVLYALICGGVLVVGQ